MKPALPSIEAAKAQAKTLRARLEAEGLSIGHGKSLELVAHQYGFRDWNTLHAAIGNRPVVPWRVGDRARGHYLGQAFAAEILSVEKQGDGWFRLTLDLDEAVDVVSFDSFSNFRKRVSGVVGPGGLSREKTSDGRPLLEVEL